LNFFFKGISFDIGIGALSRGGSCLAMLMIGAMVEWDWFRAEVEILLLRSVIWMFSNFYLSF